MSNLATSRCESSTPLSTSADPDCDQGIEEPARFASWPPCAAACPAGTDVRGYVQAIGRGNYEEAFEIARAANPFVSVCGRICAHPCEQQCRRGSVEAPISSRDLKRFVTEQCRDYRRRTRRRAVISRQQKVAVIGAGPSGLTAAVDLVNAGYPVTVFEKEPKPGGMLRNAIPKYRLPEEILQEDLDDIAALGVEICCNQELGRDFSLEDLKNKGFEAILFGIGLQLSNALPLEGVEAEGVHLALPLLRSFARRETTGVGNSVVVVGGGNVAIDVARSLRRSGVSRIRMVCLEAPHEVPASPREIREAREEGIDLVCSQGPNRILTEHGRVIGMEFKECACVFNAEGRFAPVFCEDRLTVMDCDTVVLAIGQRNDIGFAVREGMQMNGPRLVFDPQTLATATKGFFVTGELATGPGVAIQAISLGHRAARAIGHYLETGGHAHLSQAPRTVIGGIPDATHAAIRQQERVTPVNLPVEERVCTFDPFEEVLTEEAAMKEARRCLNCGTGAQLIPGRCSGCLACLRICPFCVPHVGKKASFPEEACVACGLCASECPDFAISIKRFGAETLEEKVRHALALHHDRKLVFACIYTHDSRAAMESSEGVLVHCIATVTREHILHAFDEGAETVIIKPCPNDACGLAPALPRLTQRIQHLRKDLEDIGIAGNLIYDESRLDLSLQIRTAGR